MTTREEYLKAKKLVDNYKPDRPLPINVPPPSKLYKKIVEFCEVIVNEVVKNGYSKDHAHYTFEEVFQIVYGPKFFEWWNEVYEDG